MLKNKKGVSLMIAYTLLIIIAIALSIVVSSYLTQFLPSQRAECPSDINLIIEKASCDERTQNLSLTLSNRGLFTVPAMFVRLSEEGREVRAQVNEGDEVLPTPFTPNSPSLNFIYDLSGLIEVENGKNYILEIQAAILSKRILVPCENAIITDIIQCGEGEQCIPCVGPECGTEICNVPGDEDGDCLADCEDPDCSCGECIPECDPPYECNREGECECIPTKICANYPEVECGFVDDGCGNQILCENQCEGNEEYCSERGTCEIEEICDDTDIPQDTQIGGYCRGKDEVKWNDYCPDKQCLNGDDCPQYRPEYDECPHYKPWEPGDPPAAPLLCGEPALRQFKCEKKTDPYGKEYQTGECIPEDSICPAYNRYVQIGACAGYNTPQIDDPQWGKCFVPEG